MYDIIFFSKISVLDLEYKTFFTDQLLAMHAYF